MSNEMTTRRYADEWARMMVNIWRDRIAMSGAIDTGRLLNSVTDGGHTVGPDGLEATFMFRFVEYGIYVDGGSGPEFSRAGRNALGQLDILDKTVRAERGLNRPRKRGPAWGGGHTSGRPRRARPWFDRSWYISRRVLADAWAELTAGQMAAAFDAL